MVEKKIQEDLAIIKQIMQESRQRFYNVGIHFIVWGGIVIVSLLFICRCAVDSVGSVVA